MRPITNRVNYKTRKKYEETLENSNQKPNPWKPSLLLAIQHCSKGQKMKNILLKVDKLKV